MKKPIIPILAAMLLVPAAALSQTRIDASSEASAGATAGTPGSGEAALAATARLGLPARSVHEAIAEGRARGASAAEIDRLALAAHARLETSRAALTRKNRHAPSGADIEAGAYAIAAGARTADLSRIRDAAPAERSVALSLSALTEMRARGMDGAAATTEITARLRAGSTDAELADAARAVGESTARRGGDAVRGTISGASRMGVGVGRGLGAAGSVTGSIGVGLP